MAKSISYEDVGIKLRLHGPGRNDGRVDAEVFGARQIRSRD